MKKISVIILAIVIVACTASNKNVPDGVEIVPVDVHKVSKDASSFLEKNRHKAQRKAKFYINKCRSASCMQSGWKRTSA